MARRIQTEANEEHLKPRDTLGHPTKRINISSKPPLTDNKSLLNDVRKSTLNNELKNNISSSSMKTASRIKSILASKGKEGSSRPVQTLATEHFERTSKPSTANQKQTESLVQRLFNKDSKKQS